MENTSEDDLISKIGILQAERQLDQASIDAIRLLQPGDTVEIWCSDGFTPNPGVVQSNDGNTITIASETFQHFPNAINGVVSFDTETTCSDFFEIDNDTLLYYHFKIPSPYNPNLKYCTLISNILTRALFDNQKSDNIINYPLRGVRGNPCSQTIEYSDAIERDFLDDQCNHISIIKYMRQLRKGDIVDIGVTDSWGCTMIGRNDRFFKARKGVVLSNNGEKVMVYSDMYWNKKAQIGCRSFDMKTGISSGPASFDDGMSMRGLCFYHIEVPHSFIPEHQRKYIDLDPEDITIGPANIKIPYRGRPLFDERPVDDIPF